MAHNATACIPVSRLKENESRRVDARQHSYMLDIPAVQKMYSRYILHCLKSSLDCLLQVKSNMISH